MTRSTIIGCCFLSALMASGVTAMMGQGASPSPSPPSTAAPPTSDAAFEATYKRILAQRASEDYAIRRMLRTDREFASKIDAEIAKRLDVEIERSVTLISDSKQEAQPQAVAFDQKALVITVFGTGFVVDGNGVATEVQYQDGDELCRLSLQTGIVQPGQNARMRMAKEMLTAEGKWPPASTDEESKK